MFYWSFAFSVSALVAAFLGFGGFGMAHGAAGLVRGLFVGCVVLAMSSLATGLLRGKI